MPYRFAPIGGNAAFNEALPAINANFAQLDQEAIVKIFKNDSGNNGLIVGKLSDGTFGIVLNHTDGSPAIKIYVDSDGNPKIDMFNTSGVNWLRAGVMPDGTDNIVVAKSGNNVDDAFS